MHDTHLVISLVTVGDPDRLSGGYLYHRRMADAAPQHDARIRFLSFPERPFPLAALYGPRVLGTLRPESTRVALLDSIAAAYAAPWLTLRPPRVPLLAMLHQPPGGIDHGPVRTRLQAPLDRLAYRRVLCLLVASQSLEKEMVNEGFPPNRIRVVPPGRDVAPAPAGPLPDLRGDTRAAVLCVANWVRRKRLLDVLDAFTGLPPRSATLHLAGDTRVEPRYASEIRSRLAAPDLEGRVVVHGPASREEVAALYSAADVFLLPSLREPYGTVWGEAMAFGLPVVGYRAGNLPYLAQDGEEALMAEPGDVDGLRMALERLVADEGERRRMGEAARRRALARPTWEESASLFFAAIREAIS